MPAVTETRASAACGDVDAQLLVFLGRPSSYPERPHRVERIDTHISIVFLTNKFAYKLKKPVRFDFLDFGTPAARRAMCQEEVRINRRLAADVYQGVVALTRDARGSYHWAGPADEPCEWLVKMRRLPDEARLDRRLSSGPLSPADQGLLATTLLNFYQQLPPLPVKADAYLTQLLRHVEGNWHELQRAEHKLPAAVVERVHRGQMRMLQLWPDHWRHRVCDGRIVEGHGDLRPEHIYLTPRPLVIDAIEFNAEFRQLDVLDELAFLLVECQMLGAESTARAIIDRYCAVTGDRPAGGVFEFYRSYRACVRAKVAALRAGQTTGLLQSQSRATAERYLELADEALGPYGQSLVVVVRGRSGTGKSTVATHLARQLSADLLQTDVMRQALDDRRDENREAGISSDQPYGAGRYSRQQRQAVYDALLVQADGRLQNGSSVVLDGTFLAAANRLAVARLAATHAALFVEVTCHCDESVVRQRVTERLQVGRDASEFRPEFLARQRTEDEPCDVRWPHCELETNADVNHVLLRAVDRVRQELDRLLSKRMATQNS